MKKVEVTRNGEITVEKNAELMGKRTAQGDLKVEYKLDLGTETSLNCLTFLYDIDGIMIESNFDFDVDCVADFWTLINLKEYEVEEPSPFFTIDGVLFYDTRIDKEKNFIKLGLFEEANDLKGVLLVAFPRAHPGKHYDVPKGVVGIARAAFMYSGLESLTIPESMETIECAAFFGMWNLKDLYVPNKMIRIDTAHYDEAEMNFELHPLDKKDELDEMVVALWNDVRHKEPMYSEMKNSNV